MHRFLVTVCFCYIMMAVNAINGRFYSSELLSSSSVKRIHQDNYGLIWIATDYGLSKFDGYHFQNYYHVHRDSTTLPDNNIGCFLTDREGNLWIGQGKGLVRYDYASDCFERQSFPNGEAPRVTAMIQDKAGTIYIGTAGLGMYVMAGEIRRAGEFSDGTDNNFIGRMYLDGQGNLWTGNHKNLIYLYRLEDGRIVSRHEFKSGKGEPMTFIDEGTSVLIVCKRGILRYDYATDSLGDAGFSLGDGDNDATINHALMDDDGNLYMGTYGRGLLTIRRGEKTAVREPLMQNHLPLQTPFVSCIMKDKDNNLWLGCYEMGVFLASQQKPVFDSWSLAAQDPAFAGRITAIIPADDGGVWCAVRQGCIYHVSREGLILSRVSTPPELTTIYQDRLHRFWVGAGNTLYRLDTVTRRLQKEKEFDGSGIGRIVCDDRGRLYISVYSKGICLYDVTSGDIRAFHAGTDSPDGKLINNWVGYMMTDSLGLLWIATANGLSCLNTHDHRFNSLGWDCLLEGVACGVLCETKDHDIIISGYGGLFVYRRQKNKVEPFPGAEPLEDLSISSIVEDGKGDLWISSSKGIWQYIRQEKRFVNYMNGNGLFTHQYNVCAGFLTPDGRMVFAQKDGLTVFRPSEIKRQGSGKLTVRLTRFLREGCPMDFRSDRFVIPYDKNSFAMEFSLLDYKNTDNISYQYRVNDGPWVSTVRGSNQISFGKMKSGTYYIYVRAEDNGEISPEELRLTVIVDNPWYLSAWALCVYLLIVVLIAWYILHNYNKRKQTELDEEKMKFLINATHDIRSPLTLIMGPLAKLKGIVADENGRSYIDTIDRNAQRLMLLVNQILDERKIDKGQMQLHCRETNLVEFISGICKLYQYSASQRGITFLFEHDKDHLLAWIDRINFDKVISNLLSNAFKYTYDGGEVKVKLCEQDHDIVIQVTDNGIGIKSEDTDRLFDRFYQGRNADSLGIQGTGIGLNLSRSIVEMHSGQIKAGNRADGQQGACFTVTIPSGNKHLRPEQIVSDSPAREILSAGGARAQSRQFRILIVDDDPEIAGYITGELGNKYKFCHSPNGKEALKTLLTDHYDLVISDVMMPEMDGITLLKRIKDNPNISQIPVIMLTSKAEVEHKLEGLKSGADAYIAKPFSMEELHIQIDNLIDNVRRLRGKFSGAAQQEDKVENIEVKGNNDALMERVMRSVNANMKDPDFNVDALADDVGISRAQLHRKMKEITGISSGKFLRNLRMEQAARLLREGRVNVTQVADSVGYNDQAHFSTAFKNHFGMSPSEYVATHKE